MGNNVSFNSQINRTIAQHLVDGVRCQPKSLDQSGDSLSPPESFNFTPVHFTPSLSSPPPLTTPQPLHAGSFLSSTTSPSHQVLVDAVNPLQWPPLFPPSPAYVPPFCMRPGLPRAGWSGPQFPADNGLTSCVRLADAPPWSRPGPEHRFR